MTSETTPKWQMVENVVAAIERVRAIIPGVEIVQKAQVPKAAFPDETRDLDVLVKIPVQGRVLRLGIEVKNVGRPIAEDEMGGLINVKNDLQLDRYCVVSTSGFTESAHAKGVREGIELTTLNSSGGSPFFGAVPGELVKARRLELLSVAVEGDADIVSKLVGVKANSIEVIAKGNSRTLDKVIEFETDAAVGRGQIQDHDGHEVNYTLAFTPEVKLTAAGETLDQLVSFDLRIRFHWDSVPDTRFELAGWLIMTYEADGPEGRVQVTTIAVPSPDNPELRQIYAIKGPAKPKKQKIEDSKTPAS